MDAWLRVDGDVADVEAQLLAWALPTVADAAPAAAATLAEPGERAAAARLPAVHLLAAEAASGRVSAHAVGRVVAALEVVAAAATRAAAGGAVCRWVTAVVPHAAAASPRWWAGVAQACEETRDVVAAGALQAASAAGAMVALAAGERAAAGALPGDAAAALLPGPGDAAAVRAAARVIADAPSRWPDVADGRGWFAARHDLEAVVG